MGLEEMSHRLNDTGYINWLKASRCLYLLRNGLHLFAGRHMKAFHGNLLNQNGLLRKPCGASCRPSGSKFSPSCRACSEWRTAILRHHRQPDATVNWDNCFPPNWRTDHWEVAKAYMPRGQGKKTRADECDAAALLNLINYCTGFQSVDLKCVREVIHHRNDLMHSNEMGMKDEWMKRYKHSLKTLVQQFSHVPEMASVGKQIEQMLAIDLLICISGSDFVDSDGMESDCGGQLEISADLVSQWEAELLQERLQEVLQDATDGSNDDDAAIKDTEQLKSLGTFLQANRDLAVRFSAELQIINSLETTNKKEEER